MQIHLPALKERREDIPDLAVYFLEKYSRKNKKKQQVHKLNAEVLDLFRVYPC